MSAYREYCTKSLAMVFRSRITKKVHESYFNDMSYYHIANLPGRRAIRDADERLASEVRSVSSRLTNVCCVVVCVFILYFYTPWSIYIYMIYIPKYTSYIRVRVYTYKSRSFISICIFTCIAYQERRYTLTDAVRSRLRAQPRHFFCFLFSLLFYADMCMFFYKCVFTSAHMYAVRVRVRVRVRASVCPTLEPGRYLADQEHHSDCLVHHQALAMAGSWLRDDPAPLPTVGIVLFFPLSLPSHSTAPYMIGFARFPSRPLRQ